MNNNYTSNLNLANNQYTHIDLPIAVDNYSSASDKTVTYADFIKFREILNFGYGDVNQGGKRVTIGGSTAGNTWIDVLSQIETLFEALHQRILALENAPIILETIEWESITAFSTEGSNASWPRIKCTWSNSSITYINVGDAGVSTPTINITASTNPGTYSGIKVTYNGKVTTNSLTYTVNAKTISNINWKTITGSSNEGTVVNASTITNKITVLYDNNTTGEVNVSNINVYTNAACTTSAPSTWYNNAGTYYIKGIYSGKVTTNSLTYTVNAKTISNINWMTTTGSSNEGTVVNASAITNKITVLYDNNTTDEVNVSSINVYRNTACTTSAPSTWYNNAGTYYIKGIYSGKVTSNYITWTVNTVSVTYDYYFGTANESQIQSQSYINNLIENESGKPNTLNFVRGYNVLIVPKEWGMPNIIDGAGFAFSEYDASELGIANPTNKLVYVYECSGSSSVGTIESWTSIS